MHHIQYPRSEIMAVSIRLLKDSEYPEMLKFMCRVFPNADIRISNGDRIIVADMHGQVVGFVHYAYSGNNAVIKGFGVEGNARGIGIGTGLIEEVLRKFEAADKSVYLKVKALNQAVNIYARMGFFPVRLEEERNICLLVRKVNN